MPIHLIISSRIQWENSFVIENIFERLQVMMKFTRQKATWDLNTDKFYLKVGLTSVLF